MSKTFCLAEAEYFGCGTCAAALCPEVFALPAGVDKASVIKPSAPTTRRPGPAPMGFVVLAASPAVRIAFPICSQKWGKAAITDLLPLGLRSPRSMLSPGDETKASHTRGQAP